MGLKELHYDYPYLLYTQVWNKMFSTHAHLGSTRELCRAVSGSTMRIDTMPYQIGANIQGGLYASLTGGAIPFDEFL